MNLSNILKENFGNSTWILLFILYSILPLFSIYKIDRKNLMWKSGIDAVDIVFYILPAILYFFASRLILSISALWIAGSLGVLGINKNITSGIMIMLSLIIWKLLIYLRIRDYEPLIWRILIFNTGEAAFYIFCALIIPSLIG